MSFFIMFFILFISAMQIIWGVPIFQIMFELILLMVSSLKKWRRGEDV